MEENRRPCTPIASSYFFSVLRKHAALYHEEPIRYEAVWENGNTRLLGYANCKDFATSRFDLETESFHVHQSCFKNEPLESKFDPSMGFENFLPLVEFSPILYGHVPMRQTNPDWLFTRIELLQKPCERHVFPESMMGSKAWVDAASFGMLAELVQNMDQQVQAWTIAREAKLLRVRLHGVEEERFFDLLGEACTNHLDEPTTLLESDVASLQLYERFREYHSDECMPQRWVCISAKLWALPSVVLFDGIAYLSWRDVMAHLLGHLLRCLWEEIWKTCIPMKWDVEKRKEAEAKLLLASMPKSSSVAKNNRDDLPDIEDCHKLAIMPPCLEKHLRNLRADGYVSHPTRMDISNIFHGAGYTSSQIVSYVQPMFSDQRKFETDYHDQFEFEILTKGHAYASNCMSRNGCLCPLANHGASRMNKCAEILSEKYGCKVNPRKNPRDYLQMFPST